MQNSKQIKLAADHKRSEAKRKLHQMFRIPEGFGSTTIDELVDDIITTAMLEITALQAEVSESVKRLGQDA